MSDTDKPWLNTNLQIYLNLLANSYKLWTGKPLIEPHNLAQELYTAPYIIASHSTIPDLLDRLSQDNQYGFSLNDEPRFIYGNQAALDLWEMTWHDFIAAPSKNTTEEIGQSERLKLLEEVAERGFIPNYSGVRISSSGKRFKINNAIVWNVVDTREQIIGQAVKFDDYEFI